MDNFVSKIITNMRIKEIAKQQGMSINELAKRLNIARETCSRQINEDKSIRIDTAQKYADALGVELWELFTPSLGNNFTCPHCGKVINVQISK